MTVRTINHTAKDISATLIRGDSCKIEVDAPYDLVVTSPPWPEYDNASNGYKKLPDKSWKKICDSIARLCNQASSKTGIRGVIELPHDMSDEHRKMFIDSISDAKLQVWSKGRENLLGPVVYHRSRVKPREWWVVVSSPITLDQGQLIAKKIDFLRKTLSVQTGLGRFDVSMNAWKKAAYRAAGQSRIPPPSRFASQHVIAFYECLLTEGDTVLDPFCGTGQALKLAMDMNINSIGIELSRAYAAGIEARLKEVTKPKKTAAKASKKSGKTGVVIRYMSKSEADKQGYITKKDMSKLDISFAQVEPTNYSLITGKRGHPPRLYRLKELT